MQLYILIFALTVNNISTLCMNYELQPIYTTKENIRTHKPTKPTLSLQQLAETTINLRAKQYNNETIINLIQNIKAVENSIPIDTIATYIYNKRPLLTQHLHHHQAIIRLYCLKQYLTKVKQNNETIPSQVTDIMHHKKLFERLELTNNNNTNKHLSYKALVINLNKIIDEPKENISEFIGYIYEKKISG